MVVTTGIVYSTVKSIPDAIVEVEYSDEYKLWKCQLVEEKISDVFKDFLIEDEVLKDLICPFYRDLPRIPVKARNGKYTYDQENLLPRIKNRVPGMMVGHYEDFNEEDLVFDADHFVKVIKRIKEIVEIEFNRPDLKTNNTKIIINGLMAYKHTKDSFNSDLFNKLVDDSYKQNIFLREQEIKIKGSGNLLKNTIDYTQKEKNF